MDQPGIYPLGTILYRRERPYTSVYYHERPQMINIEQIQRPDEYCPFGLTLPA